MRARARARGGVGRLGRTKIFDWLETGLVPKLFPKQEWYNGEPFTEFERDYFMNYNRVVGAPPGPCSVGPCGTPFALKTQVSCPSKY